MTKRTRILLAVLLSCGLSAFAQQQMADPNFQATVADPAYRANGPKVVIDAGHNNVHTAAGGYKPFADLMTSDGYVIESNSAPFQASALRGRQILVIVNARGAGFDAPMQERAKPAFTPQECELVRMAQEGPN